MSPTHRLIALDLPGEWLDGLKVSQQGIFGTSRHEATDTQMIVWGACLSDGTSIWALVWDHGQHLLRSGPTNGWSLEERVDPAAAYFVREAWRDLMAQISEGHRLYDAEFGRPPCL